MKRFECLRCPHCCFFSREEESPVLFSWEVRRVSELLEERGAILENVEFKPLEVYRDDSGRCVVLLYRMIVRGFCPFYDLRTRSCTIHPEKPMACRMYPLLLEVPSGRLSVSGACDWVERNMWVVKRGDVIDRVFPEEVRIARRVFAEYMEAVRFLGERGFRVKSSDVQGCKEVLDFEDVAAGGDTS